MKPCGANEKGLHQGIFSWPQGIHSLSSAFSCTTPRLWSRSLVKGRVDAFLTNYVPGILSNVIIIAKLSEPLLAYFSDFLCFYIPRTEDRACHIMGAQ